LKAAESRAFYTQKLGFQLRDDAPYGPDFRWLTVVSPDDGALELYLAHEDRYPGAKADRASGYGGTIGSRWTASLECRG
jgi:catechol 2,3-dioxygenase-like lactoylglutathione lyase family enzyme